MKLQSAIGLLAMRVGQDLEAADWWGDRGDARPSPLL